MSRVDEARRRAAEAAARSGATELPRDLAPVVGVDPAEFDGEAYPVEMPDRRWQRRDESEAAGSGTIALAARGARAADGSRVDHEEPAPIPAPTPAPFSSLFDRLDGRLAAKIVVDQKMLPASREQYRRLAATLHHQQAATGLKVVMIASAVMGEGKTLTAANLALTLSESYQRTVLLIDADLRRPSLNTVFGMNGAPGLAEGLTSRQEQKLVLHQISSWLSILPAGKPSSDPMAGLTSGRMRRVIDEARASFDWVIVDTPPVGLLTDANLLAAMVDGAVLVVHAGSTPYDLVKRAVEAIGTDRMLGVVLNRAEARAQPYGYGYDYYSGYGAPVHPFEADVPQ
jgi:protein-tyrosine kinase